MKQSADEERETRVAVKKTVINCSYVLENPAVSDSVKVWREPVCHTRHHTEPIEWLLTQPLDSVSQAHSLHSSNVHNEVQERVQPLTKATELVRGWIFTPIF